MKENKQEILNEFFKKYVFVPEKVSDTAWVDGASLIVSGLTKELENATIQEIIEFCDVAGDLNNIETYNKIREFFASKNDEIISSILNIQAQKTELSYLQTLVEYIRKYKANRQLNVEEIYDFCVENEIDVMTIRLAGENMLKIKDIYLKLPKNLSKNEKESQLRLQLNK